MQPRRIVGITKTNRQHIAVTPAGACPGTDIIAVKSADPNQTPTPQESDMDPKIVRTVLAMDDTTKSYALGLDETAFAAFLAKSADDQRTEATGAAEKAKKKKDDEEAMKSDVLTPAGLSAALEKALSPLVDKIASLETEKADLALKNQAADPAFRGYPGGPEALIPVLKSAQASGMEKSATDAIIEGCKSRATMARASGIPFGVSDPQGDTASEIAKMERDATELQKSKPELSMDEARAEVLSKRAPESFMAALDEEGALPA